MKTIIIPGGSEADSRPDGRYVAFVKHQGGCWTNWGFLENPPMDEPRWVVTSATGYRIAAQGQNDPPKGWEFDEVRWNQIAAPCGVWPVIYDNNNLLFISRCLPPTGSQGYRYVTNNTNKIVTGDETVLVRNGLNEWTDLSPDQDGNFMVGQLNTGEGIGVWIAGQLRLLTPGACFNPRAKYDGKLVSISCYNVAPDGTETRFFWPTLDELLALPLVGFTFPKFNHSVAVMPFAAYGSGSFDIFTLGLYSEAEDPTQDLILASQAGKRLVLAHDGPTLWTPPAQLRSWDIPLIEFYRLPEETMLQSAARWSRQVEWLVQHWQGDWGVIPMFYTQNRWTIDQVLEGLNYLVPLVNSSSRCKVVAPFAYNRLNGIVSDDRLMSAFRSLQVASPGEPTFIPIGTSMIKPEVTVSQFKFTPANKLGDGVWLEFHDRQNPQGAIAKVWVSNGGMYMSLEYPGIGKGETGAWRPVR